jgi:hypothetical protein
MAKITPTVVWLAMAVLVLGAGVAAAGDMFDPDGESMLPASVPEGSLDGNIATMSPDSLSCEAFITFELLPGGPPPGTNYDELISVAGADFGERFDGQVVVVNGDHDVLTELPVGPLALMAGPPLENLAVAYDDSWHSQICGGLGYLQWPSFSALGEGAIAVLFDVDQSMIGFDVMGGNHGNAWVNFFKRDGTHLDTFILTDLYERTVAFRRIGGAADIGGISIHNDDPGGVGFDNFCYRIEPSSGEPPICEIGGPYWGNAHVPIEFDGSASSDPDGEIVSYDWDFGDGGVGSGPNPTHLYQDDGFFIVTLCVTDNDGNVSCCQTYTVIDCSPVESQSWGAIKGIYR